MLRADVGMAELRCLTTKLSRLPSRPGSSSVKEVIRSRACRGVGSLGARPSDQTAEPAAIQPRNSRRFASAPSSAGSLPTFGSARDRRTPGASIRSAPSTSTEASGRSKRVTSEPTRIRTQPWRRERDSNPRWVIATAVFKNARASPYSRSARRCLLPDSPRTVRVPHNGTVREGSMPGSRCSWTRCPTWEPRGLRAVRRSRRRRRAVPRIARP